MDNHPRDLRYRHHRVTLLIRLARYRLNLLYLSLARLKLHTLRRLGFRLRLPQGGHGWAITS